MNTATPRFRILLSTALLATALTGCANSNNKADAATPTSTATITEKSTELQKVGYSLGFMMADSNKKMVDDLDLDTFEQGFRDAYADKEPALTPEQMEEIVMKYQERKEAEMVKKMQEEAVTNKKEGDAFLEANKTKPGVKTTASGLQYKVITEGTGELVKSTDTVKINYEGKLIDGKVFDSSYKRGEPAIFPVEGMIPGFTEGLQLMKKDGKYELYIPADLAYGETGNPAIGPNETLIFTVEMLEINPPAPKAAAPAVNPVANPANAQAAAKPAQ